MGLTEDWSPKYRGPVSEWLRTSEELPTLVGGLTVHTGIDTALAEELTAWLRTQLACVVDEAIASLSYYQDELSELLANAGVLPLFGFPTRIREVYNAKPRRPDDEHKLADRSLEIAVSQYAPGSEVLNENQVNICVGFAAYSIIGQRVKPIEALSRGLNINRCPDCLAVEPLPEDAEGSATCPTCGVVTTVFRLYEPLGFRTDYRPIDFDDRLERRGHAGPPQLAFQREVEWAHVGRLEVATLGDADVYTINDNGGALFSLHRFDDSYVAPDSGLYERDVALPLQIFEGRAPDKVGAIGYVKTTDVLLLRPAELDVPGPVGAIVPARCPAGLAAFWSFGELLRRAATMDVLGIDPSELQVGIQAARTSDPFLTTRQVFLADTLENGAGYAAHLGQREELALCLKTAGALNWVLDERHNRECRDSCPVCLRSYDNRFLHPYLDWRLALDVLELVRGEDLDLSRWLSLASGLAEGFSKAFGLEGDIKVEQLDGGLWGIYRKESGRAIVLSHPLWYDDPAWFTTEQALAEESARRLVPTVQFFDVWRLVRRPQIAFSLLMAEPSP
jgi:DEAD/DEAH box helicase domain-containing protein